MIAVLRVLNGQRTTNNGQYPRLELTMSFKRTLIASAMMILTMVFLHYMSHGIDIRPNRPLSSFPTKIGDWVGKQDRFSDEVYEILGVDDSFLASYNSSDGRQVQLYVGFYQSQREGDLIHSPKHCLPGAGWNIVHTSAEQLMITALEPRKIRMIKLILEKGGQKQVVLYWFQSRGRFIASEYMQKVYLVIDSITRQRTDGSFVRLIAPAADGDEENATESIKDFTRLLVPILQEYIPS